jgi:hypothetical protein
MAYLCDWCGEEIHAGSGQRGVASVDSSGQHTDRFSAYARIGHFHAGDHDEDSCLQRVRDLIRENCATSRSETPRERRARQGRERERAAQYWERLSPERREALVLDVVADDALIVREVTGRINAALGVTRAAYPTAVAALLKRMVAAGHLVREPETFNKTHMRYRYFRNQTLEGPIAQLERSYHDEPAEETA